MPTDDIEIVTLTVCVGQSLMFMQCDDFVSMMGQLVAMFDKRLLICTFIFHALWSPNHCIPSDHCV